MGMELFANLDFLVVILDAQGPFDLWKQATQSCVQQLGAGCGGQLRVLWSPVSLLQVGVICISKAPDQCCLAKEHIGAKLLLTPND